MKQKLWLTLISCIAYCTDKEPDKGHLHALEHFVDEIHGTGPMVCGVDDAMMATRVAFAAFKAAAEKRTVKMEEI